MLLAYQFKHIIFNNMICFHIYRASLLPDFIYSSGIKVQVLLNETKALTPRQRILASCQHRASRTRPVGCTKSTRRLARELWAELRSSAVSHETCGLH